MCLGVAESAGDLVQGAFERRVGERADLAAVRAHEMVMVVPIRAGRLEAGDPVTEVDPSHEPLGCEEVEDAVDACYPDAASGCAQLDV